MSDCRTSGHVKTRTEVATDTGSRATAAQTVPA